MNINPDDARIILQHAEKAEAAQFKNLSPEERKIVQIALKNIKSGTESSVPTDPSINVPGILKKLALPPPEGHSPTHVSFWKGILNRIFGLGSGSLKEQVS